MAQYAILIYDDDSGHVENAASEELAAHDRHAKDLQESGVMVAAFALRPRETAT